LTLSPSFFAQNVGVNEVSDRIWLAALMNFDLGYFDHEKCGLEPVDDPFEPKVLPMAPG
jgi:putative transposase